MDNWFIWRNGQQLGPYSATQVMEMQLQGRLYPDDLYYGPGCADWLPAAQAAPLWQTAASAGYQAAQPLQPYLSGGGIPPVANIMGVPPMKPRKKKGCLIGCFTVIAVVCATIVFLAVRIMDQHSDNLILGEREKLDAFSVPKEGGSLTVDSPASPLNGMTIRVENGSFTEDVGFDISIRSIQSHAFGDNFHPVTPLITIDNRDKFASKPVLLDIPVVLSENEFAMGFYYNEKTGKLEGIPLAGLDSGHVTLATCHFSEVVVSKIDKSALESVEIDTGFMPGVDDWQFVNKGSWLEPGGHCAGQSITAMWYYYEKYLAAGERRLYGRYDNNNWGMGTIDFQEDDSWGYRFASVVQREMDWDAYSRVVFSTLSKVTDGYSWNAFVYSMLLTREPQFVAIYRYYNDKNGKPQMGGHAIVAYKISGDKLYVADPNYPGVEGRYIQFTANGFRPYSSGANAIDIKKNGVRVYTEIYYVAKSALVNWSRVTEEYNEMLQGKVGNNLFPKYELTVLKKFNSDSGAAEWEECPDVIETGEADTAKVDERYRGKLVFSLSSGYSDQRSTLYRGTSAVQSLIAGNKGGVVFTVPLEKGANDLGFLTEYKRNNEWKYADFRRIKVIYEQQDISGTWDGYFVIEDAGKLKDFLVSWLTKFVIAVGITDDEAKARSAVESSITSDVIGVQTPIRMIFSLPDPEKPGQYDVSITYAGSEGELIEMSSKAKFEEDVLRFKFTSEDGSVMNMEGHLAGNAELGGEFSVDAWYFLKDAFIGSWKVTRAE